MRSFVFLTAFTICWIQPLLGAKICNLDDEECVTRAVKGHYSSMVKGIPGVLETSEPLYIETINARLPTLLYILENATLSGMKDCTPTTTGLNTAKSTFKHYLHCPRLVLNSHCTMSGTVFDMTVDGEGELEVTYEDYIIKIDGVIEKQKGEDNKDHMHIKSHTLDVDVGFVVYKGYGIFGDKDKDEAAEKYFNDNWKVVNKMLRGPTIGAFVEKFVNNIITYLEYLPNDEVYLDRS